MVVPGNSIGKNLGMWVQIPPWDQKKYNMKTIVLGDTHGKSFWKLIVNKENPDKVIFVGDYFDSFELSGAEQMFNFKEIIEYKKTSGKEVVMMIGNHDFHYFPEIGANGTSGYQAAAAFNIRELIDENREHLQMAHIHADKFLITHAGVSPVFLDQVFFDGWSVEGLDETLNKLFKENPQAFGFNGFDPYGDNVEQTPIWIRPYSLLKANKESIIKPRYVQIVGHTRVKHVDIEGKATGGRYYFIDILDSKIEYLIINDQGEVSLGEM